MDRFYLVNIAFFRNYSDFFAMSNRLKDRLTDKGLIISHQPEAENIMFPLRNSKFLNIFDYSEILRKKFNINAKLGEKEAIVPELETRNDRQISNIEKRVYMGLLANPDVVDNHVGKKIGVTRQSITKIRRRLEADGLIGYARIPIWSF